MENYFGKADINECHLDLRRDSATSGQLLAKDKGGNLFFFPTLGDFLFLFLTVWEFVLCLKKTFKASFLFCTIIHV